MLDKAKNRGEPKPYMRNISVRWGSFDLSDVQLMPFEPHEHERYSVQRGDVVICEGGEPGRCAVWTREEPYYIQKALHRARCGPNLHPLFLAFLLEHYARSGALAKRFTGSTIKHLPGEVLSTIRVRYPPMAEQRSIVAAIELHFSRLAAAVALLERVKANLKRARASVLKAAVGGRLVPTEAALARAEGRDYEPASVLLKRILAERHAKWVESGARGRYSQAGSPDPDALLDLPEGWIAARLDAIADIQLGQQRHPDHAAAAVVIPYIRAANITWAGLDLSDVKAMGFPNPKRYNLEVGDVLLSEASGSPMEAGKPAIWQDEIPGACFQKTVLRVRPFEKASVLPRYLRYRFLNDCWSGRFAKAAPGVGIVHLTAERMLCWPFPLPPVAEQVRIVAQVDRRLSVLDALDHSVAANLARCARLRQSVLKRAFEGRLVPHEPSPVRHDGTPAQLPDAV